MRFFCFSSFFVFFLVCVWGNAIASYLLCLHLVGRFQKLQLRQATSLHIQSCEPSFKSVGTFTNESLITTLWGGGAVLSPFKTFSAPKMQERFWLVLKTRLAISLAEDSRSRCPHPPRGSCVKLRLQTYTRSPTVAFLHQMTIYCNNPIIRCNNPAFVFRRKKCKKTTNRS